MAMDLKWLLSADDQASGVFNKVKEAGTGAASGIQGAFSGVQSKFNLLTGAVGTLAAVAGGMMFKSIIKETVDWAGGIGKLAGVMGTTTAQASVFAVAMAKVGVDQETAEKAALKLAMTMGKNPEIFEKLGVAIKDSNGNLRSTAEIMPEVNKKLGEMQAGTDRNVIAMQLYGKSWSDVRGLLKINTEVMKEAQEQAERLHLIVGDEGVKQAKKYKESLNEINLVGKSLTIQFGNVLLPEVVKVGTFLGKNGPLLADAFRISLQFLGKTVTTLGEWLGLLAFRAVSLGSILKSVFTGNFKDARQEFTAMVAAGEEFNKRTSEKWKNWKSDPVKSTLKTGNKLDVSDTAAEEDDSKAKIKLWQDHAKTIIENEKEMYSKRLELAKEHLKVLKTHFEEAAKELDTFTEAYQKVQEKAAARSKTDLDAKTTEQRGPEDAYQNYIRQQSEIKVISDEIRENGNWTSKSIAEDIVKLDDQIERAKTLRDLAKAGKVENISADQAESDYLITNNALELQKKELIDAEDAKLTDIAVKASESVTLQERAVKNLEAQVHVLDKMLKNIPNVSEKVINLKINGIQDLYKLAEVMANTSPATVETTGDGGGEEARASGGPVRPYATYRINENGTEYLTMGSKGGYITPHGQKGSSVTINAGGINVTVQSSGSADVDADELARKIVPAIKKYLGRSL